MTRPVVGLFGFTAFALALAVVVLPYGDAQTTPASTEPVLPTRPAELTVEVAAESTIRVAVPNFLGRAPQNTVAAEVLRGDFANVGLFQVIDARQFPAGYETEALGIRRASWTALHADAVVKAEVRGTAPNIELELRLYEVGRVAGDNATVTKVYRGTDADLRRFVHLFANEVLRAMTGTPGAFDTQVLFARRIAMGRKQIYESDYDGANLHLVVGGDGVSMFPAYGAAPDIWYSRLTEFGIYITNSGRADAEPIIRSNNGMNMNPAICDGRIFFSSTRDGNAEIYSAALDGTDIRRLTDNPAIDVTPACGPSGMLAFVSNRQGTPQIWTMTQAGANPTRVTFRGDYNQTPSWCTAGNRSVIAFTGRDQSLDIFTVDMGTRAYTRLTQAQGTNKDPSWSPDCRMLAFHSSRSGGGIYVSNPSGFNQRRVLDGHAETIRWSPRRSAP